MALIQKEQASFDLTPRSFERKGDRYPDYRALKSRGKGRKAHRPKGGDSLRALAALLLADDEE